MYAIRHAAFFGYLLFNGMGMLFLDKPRQGRRTFANGGMHARTLDDSKSGIT